MTTMLRAAIMLFAALSGAACWGEGALALRDRYAALQPALAASPFGRPLLLQAGSSSTRAQGDVYALVDHPFTRVAPALQGPAHWCQMLMLQFNIKRCAPGGQPPHESLELAVGRKADQPVKDAFALRFVYSVLAAQPDYLSVQMSAGEGPLGTRDYRLTLQAVPVDTGHSFIHLSYAYTNGLAARLATDAYLATFGRRKVGFSIVGRDPSGEPIYVTGIQGVAERNAMRYFLAVDAHLDALSVPRERQTDKRLREWFAETERYPLQLHEMDLDDYLALKRREM
ncbi:hypothetical protein [Ideonella sp.]|uniref:hypothetical protein n=1 Tax=Ideonella sp. TaxID=1929293 RepID=UPI002B4A7D32|nr:hypothetical protein [Ideonella sp.]HJV67730.1 hypothetical protein [Ideonella sp.]